MIYGTTGGLQAGPTTQLWSQNSPAVESVAQPNEGFGRAVAGADINGDGFDDLAVGVGESVPGASIAGGVNVIYGSANRLSATIVPDQLWTQDSPFVEGASEASDAIGTAVTLLDFNGDGFADIAAGAPSRGRGSRGCRQRERPLRHRAGDLGDRDPRTSSGTRTRPRSTARSSRTTTSAGRSLPHRHHRHHGGHGPRAGGGQAT